MSDAVNTEEVWKAIPGWPSYSASSLGRIKSYHNGGRILKPHLGRNGYFRVCLSDDGFFKYKEVHRLVLSSFGGESEGKECNHKDGDKQNNRIENLEWVTPSGNKLHFHRVICGRIPKKLMPKAPPKYSRGETHYAHKMTEGMVRSIPYLRSQGWSQQRIATLFGVAQTQISAIEMGKKWKHIKSTAELRCPM